MERAVVRCFRARSTGDGSLIHVMQKVTHSKLELTLESVTSQLFSEFFEQIQS